MKKLLSMFCILILASCAEVLDPPKYQYGDCITPTDKTSSWYGEYAKVDAYVRVADDISGSAYVLWFPTFKVNRNIFKKEIELSTKKVDYLENCGLPS